MTIDVAGPPTQVGADGVDYFSDRISAEGLMAPAP